jgi:hypothetical protein
MTTLKANDNKEGYDPLFYNLPLLPLSAKEAIDTEIYARFMKHLRLVPSRRIDIKILSAIQFTSDMMNLNDAIVTKTLADMGLRAPRSALPETYLEYVDLSLKRSGMEVGGPCASTISMQDHWDQIGNDDSDMPPLKEISLPGDVIYPH